MLIMHSDVLSGAALITNRHCSRLPVAFAASREVRPSVASTPWTCRLASTGTLLLEGSQTTRKSSFLIRRLHFNWWPRAG